MNVYICHRSVYSSLFDRKAQPLISRVPYIYFSLGELLLYNVVLISALQQQSIHTHTHTHIYICIYIHIYIHTHIYMHSLSSLLPTSTSHPSRSSQSTELSSLCSTAFHFVVVQWLCRARVFATPWTIACQALLPSTVSKSLLKSVPIES